MHHLRVPCESGALPWQPGGTRAHLQGPEQPGRRPGGRSRAPAHLWGLLPLLQGARSASPRAVGTAAPSEPRGCLLRQGRGGPARGHSVSGESGWRGPRGPQWVGAGGSPGWAGSSGLRPGRQDRRTGGQSRVPWCRLGRGFVPWLWDGEGGPVSLVVAGLGTTEQSRESCVSFQLLSSPSSFRWTSLDSTPGVLSAGQGACAEPVSWGLFGVGGWWGKDSGGRGASGSCRGVCSCESAKSITPLSQSPPKGSDPHAGSKPPASGKWV